MKTRSACRFSLTLLCTAVCAFTAGGVVRADDSDTKSDGAKYDLRYKLSRGDVLRYEVTHRASIQSTIDTSTQAVQSKTDSIKAWKVTDVLENGDIEITSVVEKVHMVNQLPDKDPVEYDSTKDAIAPPGFEDAAKAVGVPLSVIRITPQGKVIRRDLKVRGQGSDDNAPIVLRLPEQPVAIGETWDEPFDVQVKLDKSNTKMIQTRRHYKLADVKDGIATIEVAYQVLSPIDARIETQIVQRLMEGEARFDIEKGQLIGQQMDIDKRIIGFAGATSSMQYLMKMEESLLKDQSTTAATEKPATKKTSTTSTANKSSNKSTKAATQTADRTATVPSTTKKSRK